jgi:hypothetical protein
MSIKTTLKASVAAAALIAVAAPVISSPAEAGLANGNDNNVVISGALNRGLLHADNGSANDWTNVDGGTDNSRLRILVSGKLTESISVGGAWEANLPISQPQGSVTSGTSDVGTTSAPSAAFGLRKTDITFTHATMGKLSIGQSSTSSDNKPSLGSVGGNSNDGVSFGSGMRVFDKTGNANLGSATTGTAGAQFSSYFGGRRDRIRYDLPKIAGFGVSASMADQSFYDVGLTYGATYGDIVIAAAAQYANLGTDSSQAATVHGSNQYGVGLAVKHASGLSAGAHWGEEGGNSNTANAIAGHAWGVEAGYTTTAISNLGSTSFEVIYVKSNDAVLANMEADNLSFHVQQKMPAGVDLYAAYSNASFEDDNAGTNLEDLSVFMVGTRLSF